MRIATLIVLPTLLSLAACGHHRREGHDDEHRDEPGERHSVGDTASDTDTGTDTGVDTSADTATDTDPAWTASVECGDAPLRLTGARVSIDATTITSGSTFALTVTIQNASGADDMAYPGVLFASSSETVSTTPGSDWLYGLFAGQSNELGANFAVAPDAPLPEEVVLTATTTRLGCERGETTLPDGTACPAACVLSYPLTIQAAR
jgi:hypothetical protein